MEELVELGLRALRAYLGLGVAFGLLFVSLLVARVDPSARGGSLGFRLVVLPGVALLWPLFVWRLLRGRAAPVERTAHREAAERRGPGAAERGR